MPETFKSFAQSKIAEWSYRGLVLLLLAALAFVRDAATKRDLVPIRTDIAEIRRAIAELDKKMAVNEALRVRDRRSGE